MNWFQRYGIPGAVFWGLLILWSGAFQHCAIDELINNTEKAKIIVAVAAGSFLPLGYFFSIIGQLLYHTVPGFGVDTKARKSDLEVRRKISRIFFGLIRWLFGVEWTGPTETGYEGECNSDKEWEQEVCTINAIIRRLNENSNSKKLEREDIDFVLRWMSKRMDMIVINTALILALVFTFILSLILVFFSRCQFNWRWFGFTFLLTALVYFICRYSRKILTKQLVRVERKFFTYLD